jgi:predicted Zn-dependent peptidase
MGFYLLGSGFQSRLVKRIREEEGISYDVGGNFETHPIYIHFCLMDYHLFLTTRINTFFSFDFNWIK